MALTPRNVKIILDVVRCERCRGFPYFPNFYMYMCVSLFVFSPGQQAQLIGQISDVVKHYILFFISC